jgi:hypothetical protein
MATAAPIEAPRARPGCAVRDAVDERLSATAWIIGKGLAGLSREERQGVVVAGRRRRLDRPRPLIVDQGCGVQIGGTLLEGAERAAALLWLPLAPDELVLYERGLFRDRPLQSLSLLLRPPTIWSEDEVMAAERRFPRGRRFRPERFDVVERYALRLAGSPQHDAVRRAARNIAAQLPMPDLPEASVVVAAACEAVFRDDRACAAAAARQLARFACSEHVARSLLRSRQEREPLVAPAATVNSS